MKTSHRITHSWIVRPWQSAKTLVLGPGCYEFSEIFDDGDADGDPTGYAMLYVGADRANAGPDAGSVGVPSLRSPVRFDVPQREQLAVTICPATTGYAAQLVRKEPEEDEI